nr:UDP-glycosyltransferase 83A1-like [Ipomoea batatas]
MGLLRQRMEKSEKEQSSNWGSHAGYELHRFTLETVFSDPGIQRFIFDMAFISNESVKAAEWDNLQLIQERNRIAEMARPKQPLNSVILHCIRKAHTIFNMAEFQELALGLGAPPTGHFFMGS